MMYTNVIDILEEYAQKQSDKPFLIDDTDTYSYECVVKKAQMIGSKLLKYNVTKKPVIIFVDRDAISVINFFGVVYAGGFYVPVDINLPSNRIEKIIKTTNSEIIITPEKFSDKLNDIEFDGKVLIYEEISSTSEMKTAELKEVKSNHKSINPLYMIFTSGSTGVPKGVLVSHQSVLDLQQRFQKVFSFSNDDVFANQAPFDFDVSVKDIYMTLYNGATMVIVKQRYFVEPVKLIEMLNKYKVTTLIWAASAMTVLSSFKTFNKAKPEYLKNVMFSGEVLPMKTYHYWKENLPEVRYVNLYGPTEITCNCTYYIVDREFSTKEQLPIGQAFPNMDVFLLDGDTPSNEGEICVSGTGVALGYYNNNEESEKRFVQNPLNNSYREIIYRTGDMGKYNEFGELMYVSRKDDQIKHMGHRIELGEIEMITNSLSYLRKSCCVYHNNKIVLFYESDEEHNGEIMKNLTSELPKYMCPNKYVWLTEIPMNSHGKTDRKKLKEML